MELKTPEILAYKEVLSLRPRDRDGYIQGLILQILEMNPQGVTIAEISKKTGLNRNTIAKHLKRLVAIREAYALNRGNLSIYYKNGKVVHSRSSEHKFANDKFFTFYRLENDEGRFIYIQEKEIDEFRATKVKGGILVKDQDFLSFMKELQKFALEVTQNEST
jgi:DNA-binding Lrp family transcriptional regulator